MGYIKICVIGAGKWGKNHIRTLSELGALGGVVETDSHERNQIIELYPNVSCLSSIEDAFEADFDGYVVATPPITHVELAEQILRNNKPVLVEKPLTILYMAERMGFEPMVPRQWDTRFPVAPNRPLWHLSVVNTPIPNRKNPTSHAPTHIFISRNHLPCRNSTAERVGFKPTMRLLPYWFSSSMPYYHRSS